MLVRRVSASAYAPSGPILLWERLVWEGGRVWAHHENNTSTPLSLLFHLISYFLGFMISNSFSNIKDLHKLRFLFKQRNLNISNTHKQKKKSKNQKIIIKRIHQLSRCRVAAQSLGKCTRSLGTNVVVVKTGARDWEVVRTAHALCFYSNVSLIISIIIVYRIYKLQSFSYINVLYIKKISFKNGNSNKNKILTNKHVSKQIIIHA